MMMVRNLSPLKKNLKENFLSWSGDKKLSSIWLSMGVSKNWPTKGPLPKLSRIAVLSSWRDTTNGSPKRNPFPSDPRREIISSWPLCTVNRMKSSFWLRMPHLSYRRCMRGCQLFCLHLKWNYGWIQRTRRTSISSYRSVWPARTRPFGKI